MLCMEWFPRLRIKRPCKMSTSAGVMDLCINRGYFHVTSAKMLGIQEKSDLIRVWPKRNEAAANSL